jgi:hypothetical protein
MTFVANITVFLVGMVCGMGIILLTAAFAAFRVTPKQIQDQDEPLPCAPCACRQGGAK